MKKIMVIGCCGAGKSTFSKKLGRQLSLEIIHLDYYYWKPKWERPNSEEWEKTVLQLCEKEKWIIDGNYNSTIELRAKKADTIIFLDYPIWKCLYRVISRMIKFNGKTRDDMPEGCVERFDWSFLKYVVSFNRNMRNTILNKLLKFENEKTIHIFKSDKDADLFLEKSIETKNVG